jgi:hypothetical protein
MLEVSIALGLGKDPHPLDRGPIGVAEGVHVATEGLEGCANPPNRDFHHIDPMMLLRGLPIIVPNGLRGVTILANLPKFAGFPNED